jgi:hypothetical protein
MTTGRAAAQAVIGHLRGETALTRTEGDHGGSGTIPGLLIPAEEREP